MKNLLHQIGWASACAALTTTPLVAEERPNIVLFLVDDMGLMDTSLPFDVDT